MDVRIESSWKEVLGAEFEKDYFAKLVAFVKEEYSGPTPIYPPARLIFNAFDHCPFNDVKVVILGQDPYHGAGQANGLCFSVNKGVPFPPSLHNIFKEVEEDCGSPVPRDGDLTRWSDQGVLLLNATLTVEAHKAGSHQGKGWEELTDAAIQALNQQREHIVFMLWGSYAQRKGQFIDRKRHLVLTAVHPSPLSAYRGFIGCGHFSQANNYLQQHGEAPINW